MKEQKPGSSYGARRRRSCQPLFGVPTVLSAAGPSHAASVYTYLPTKHLPDSYYLTLCLCCICCSACVYMCVYHVASRWKRELQRMCGVRYVHLNRGSFYNQVSEQRNVFLDWQKKRERGRTKNNFLNRNKSLYIQLLIVIFFVFLFNSIFLNHTHCDNLFEISTYRFSFNYLWKMFNKYTMIIQMLSGFINRYCRIQLYFFFITSLLCAQVIWKRKKKKSENEKCL